MTEDDSPASYSHIVSDTPKMLRETLCVAQTTLGGSTELDRKRHIHRLQRLIDACDNQLT